MAITVGPTERCTHHVALKDSDGYQIGIIAAAVRGGVIEKDVKHLNRSPVDRTAMKTSSGDTEYSDWRPPYYALKQDDFSGGRGLDDFNKDKTKFLDSGGLNTRRGGYLHLNGQEQLSGLLRPGGQIQPGNMAQPSVPSPDSTEWATKCTPTDASSDEVIYDDDDSGWTYTGSWVTATSTGFYGGSTHYTGSAGDTAEFTFTGTGCKFIYTKYTNRGTFKVYIDEVLEDTIDANAALSFQVEWDSGVLANSEHTLKIEYDSGGTHIDVDAIKITGTALFNQVWFWSHLDTAISGVKLYNGASAAFASLLQTCPDSTPPSFAPGWHVIDLTVPVSADTTNGVWISIPLVAGTTKYAPDDEITGYLKQAGSPVEDDGFPCRLLVKKLPSFGKLFTFFYRLYYLQTIDDVTHLWKNGYVGVLSIGGTKTVTDDTYSGVWEEDELAGGIFLVRLGTGYAQHQRWRRILSNTATGDITFENPFDDDLDATSSYCILGLDYWEEVPGGTVGVPTTNAHGLSGHVFDVILSNAGLVYFAQGSGSYLVKMWEGADTTLYFSNDAASSPRYITEVGRTLWGVDDVTQARSAAAASSITDAYTTARVWSDSIYCGDVNSTFTNVIEYNDGSGAKAPMIFKEGEFGFISQGTYNRVQLDEMKVLADAKNGRAAIAHDTNVYFSLGNGLERWYHPNLDDVGPNKDEGLPEERSGATRALAGYPGRFFAGVDGGDTGYSSVLSSGGWHEEWRGAYGQRVLSVMPQTIPGSSLDRLWIAAGGDLLWVPMPSETSNPLNDSNMLYTAGGYMESSSYYTELKTALKYIASIKFIFKDILSEQYSEIQYSLDEGTTWTDLDDATNPTTDDDSTILYNLTNVVSGTPYYGLNGYSLRLRIKLFTTDRTKTPVMKALVIEGLARIVNKYSYTVPFVLEGSANRHPIDLLNQEEVDSNGTLITADGKLATLIDWADEGPLFMESMDARFDNKMVLLLPFVETLVKRDDQSGEVQYIGQLTLQDA